MLNALAAAAVGLLLGETPEQIAQGLLPIRRAACGRTSMSRTATKSMRTAITPARTRWKLRYAVLGAWRREAAAFAVLGSMLELGDYAEEGHRRAGRAAAQYADALYAYGPDAEAMVAGAKEKGHGAGVCV